MNFIRGRNNFALSVFVPSDCPFHCDFCTSKDLYKKKFNMEQALFTACSMLGKFNYSEVISDVVFTGGEPMMDITGLKKMVGAVSNKNVYINTLLLKQNLFAFIDLVNTTPCVKGISISRHERMQDDQFGQNVLAEDFCVDGFKKNVRINVIVRPEMDEEQARKFVEHVLERWANYNVMVNFRADYRTVTPETLHSFQDPFFKILAQENILIGRTYCDVCDTSFFKWGANMQKEFAYHRGLENSSIKAGNTMIVNDAIMKPTVTEDITKYELSYDWSDAK